MSNQELNDQRKSEVSGERQGPLNALRQHADFLRFSGLRNAGDRAVLGAAAGALLAGETIGGALPTLIGAIGGAAIGVKLRPGHESEATSGQQR